MENCKKNIVALQPAMTDDRRARGRERTRQHRARLRHDEYVARGVVYGRAVIFWLVEDRGLLTWEQSEDPAIVGRALSEAIREVAEAARARADRDV